MDTLQLATDAERRAADSVFVGFLFAGLVAYVMVNRLIADIYTLPVGMSIRAGELVLAIVAGVLVWRVAIEPVQMPRGAVALAGVALLALVLTAPLLHIADLSDFQAATYDQGIVRFMLMAVLFVAAYQIGWDAKRAKTLIYVVVVMTCVEGSIAIYEALIGRPTSFLGRLWTGVGFEVDPSALSLRGESEVLLLRLTGELRAAATAPHPLVLSAVLALGVLIALVLYLNTDQRRHRFWAGFAALVQLAAAAATNSRTGFVMIFIIGLLIAAIYSYRVVELLQMAFVALFGIPIVFVVSPQTPRLLLNFFTGVQTDHNVQIRIERLAALPDLLAQRPFVGAGYLTHDPAIIIFDNAYNLALVELGIAGLGLILAFFSVVALRTLGAAFRHRRSEPGVAAVGGVAAVSLLLGGITFDAWTFDQFLPTCVLLMGLGVARADALWTHRAGGPAPAVPASPRAPAATA